MTEPPRPPQGHSFNCAIGKLSLEVSVLGNNHLYLVFINIKYALIWEKIDIDEGLYIMIGYYYSLPLVISLASSLHGILGRVGKTLNSTFLK